MVKSVKFIKDGATKLSECSCLSQYELSELSKALDLYKQDHNADHLFDYLSFLHTSFVNSMDKNCCDNKEKQHDVEEPSQNSYVPVYAEPKKSAIEIPIAQGAEAIIPAEVILKKEEMRVEPPTETAADA